jgi:hypothetical protein
MNFTIHALERLAERSSVSPTTLEKQLEDHKFVSLGIDPRQEDLESCLCYIVIDGKFIVAIRNIYTHAVVTVWPVEYSIIQGWDVSPKRIRFAKQLATNKSLKPLSQVI